MSLTPQAYRFQAPTGVPGDIDRVDESSVEPALQAVQGSDYPVVGMGVQYTSDGDGIQVPSGGAATAFAGVMIREVPQIANSSASDATFDPTTPLVSVPVGLLVRGYVAVKCVAGTPVRGGVVYWQVTDHSGVKAGSFRADGTDSGNAVALTATQAEWAVNGVGPDASGSTDIAILRVAR
jgi:hypothetical protein